MSALRQVMQVIGSHHISNELLESDCDKSGGLISNGEYAWFAAGANIILYSKQLGAIVSSRSFATNQKDKSLTITFVQELHKSENSHFLLVGCSCKSFGILFVCQLPTLTTIRCIHIPNPISYISTINNESLAQDQLCDEFKVMSTVLLVGMITGAVFAVDLRHRHIENQLRRNEIVVNESRPSKLFIIRKNEDCQEVKEMSDDSDCHLAMFINENFCIYCKKQYRGKLNFSISSLLYNEEINTVAIGYSTGHFQLWDCKVMRTIYLLKDPKCVMPVTHITFLEPSDDPNNLCYLWVIQSDNSRLPNAMMIALTYEQRTMMSNGCLSYRVYKGNGIKLEMSLRRESGIGRCISALTLCNVNLFRNETDMDEDCEIRLFAMLMEIRQNVDASPESYVFLFDINQWYKAQMPSNINHLKVSNSYASFVKLPHNVSYLDLNISDKTLRPFGYNFRNNVEELYYPSSIYFECDCLLDNEIIRFKHAGVQQEILDQLLLKNWRLLINPSLIFSQCLQTNLRPFFWDKTDDYGNYSLPDQRSFVISIIVENKIMSVLSACAEEWKNGTYVSSEATILHLVQCLWKHVMVVKQYADKLCVPLFDYSGTQLGKKNERILNHCLSQMLCVKHFLEDLHNAYGIHIINVDYSYRVYTLNLVTQYFKAVTCFLNYGLLPESNEEDPTQKIIKCDFTSLIQYAIKRRLEFGDLPLYLIDAFVSNEPKGNKLIEQWQHEGGEATKGLYPPSNVQCLLRIYLNAALSNQVKDFITIYFLIDVCSSHEIDVLTANRMCNFAIEFDVENKGLNTLSRATWLLDHDMFEEAMDILASSHEWLVKDKSWDWYHWTVLKLLVYKEQYFWARFYMQLTKISLVNIDDHKFYVNLQIMNNQCFDTLIYLRARPFKEKQTLFEYFFDRCRETNRLKCLIEYLWDADEAELFFSYLKRFDDTETLTFQLLFLLQRGRHKEAIKLNQTLKASLKSNNNDALTITSLLVDRFEKNIPNIMKNDYGRLPLQSVYKKPNVVVKCMNNESKMFVMDRNKVNNLVKRQSASFTPSNSIDLFLPVNKSTRKRSPVDDMICNEKRRKIDENLLSTPNANNKIVKPIEKQVLEILNTPLVEKTIASPSITSYSSILKTKLGTNKHKISFGLDKTPRSSIRFSLPGNADTTVERVDFEEVVNPQQIDNPENESFYSISSSDANDLPNQIIPEQIPLTFQESLEDNSKMNMSDEYEKMDISEENPCSGHEQIKIDDMSENETKDEEMVLSSADECVILTSDEEDDKKISVSKLLPKNTSLALNGDIKLLTPKSVPIDKEEILNQHYTSLTPLDVDNNRLIPNIQKNLSKNEKPLFTDNSTACLIQNTNSNEQRPVKKTNDIDCILLDSDEDESDNLSVGSSRKKLSDDSFVSDGSVITDGNIGSDGSIIASCGTNESDGSIASEDSITSDDGSIASDDGSAASEDSEFESTRYGRFKSQSRPGEDSNDEELEEEYIEEEDEIEEEEIEEDEIEECEIKHKGKEEEIAEECEEEEIEEEEIAEEGEEEEDEVDEIVEEGEEFETYDVDSEESEREVSPKQCKNVWVAESDSELNSEVSNESNLENPCMDDLDQQNIKFDKNEEKIINNCGITSSGNEEIGSENKDKRYDSDNDENKSGHVFINQNEDEDQEDFECVENEEYHSEKFADKAYDENEDNLEEPYEASDENNSEEPDVTIESENEENLKVQNVLDDTNEEHNLEEPNSILVGENDENLEVSDVILNNENEEHKSEEPNSIHVGENDENLERPDGLLDDDTNEQDSEEPNSILVGENDENLEVSDVILNNENEEHKSEEPNGIHVGENDENLERPDGILDDDINEQDSEEPNSILVGENDENLEVSDVILNNENEEHKSEEPNGIHVGENDENLEQPDGILDDDTNEQDSEEVHSIIDDASEENSLEEPDVLDVASEENSSEEPDVLDVASEDNSSGGPDVSLNVGSEENNSEVLEYANEQNSFEESNEIFNDESNANNLKLFKTLENEKTSENNELVDNNEIVYPIDSQSNSLENPTPHLYDIAEETHSNDNSQICDEENENSRSIIIEDDKTNDSRVIEDNENVIEVVENTDKVNKPINLDNIENNKDDLSIDQNEDNHCDEYTSPNNDHSFEMFRNESNPIPDDGFNHLTMPGVEADQLEMDVNQSTPFMFGESFFGQQEIPEKKPMLLFGHLYCFENEHLNVDVQANKLETQESDIVNNGVDITNKEPEVETEGEIQDILELESLPESNPDNNFDTQNDTDSNNLQPECKEFNETLNDNGQFPHCPDASSNIQNFANENKINLVENLAKLDKCCQKSSLNIPRTENYSLRSSSRRSISKTKECLLDIPSTTEQKLTLNKTKLLTEPIQENKTIVIDQIKKAKSIPSVDMTPITTRSRAKSEPKQVQLEPISSNIFRSSGMVEDTSRQVRVSLSKKRSKSQENIPSIKRRSGRSKSLAPVEKSETNKRKTVFGLEEIPEEDTPNTDTNIIKTEHNTALKKKPKFNFLSNSSKKLEYVNLNPKCQQDTKIRTPRRSKSLQPDPVLTFSVVKTKPKRSSSVNMLISNDEISTEKDDLMGVLKKALNPPEKIKKRSVTESLRSRKKQKTQNQVEEEKKEVAGSKYNSNESNQSYQFSNSSNSSEQLSPIVGNISQHMLYTPANKRNKIRMITLDSENDDSSSDESTDSNRIMTRSMIQNSSIVELDPIHRTLKSEIRPSKVSINRQRRRSSSVSSITEIKTPKKSDSSVFEKDELLFPKHKSKHIKEPIIHAPIEPSIEPPSTSERRITRFQQSILDKSLQSTSVIGQDTTTNNITMPKPEKKKITKKK